MKTIRVLAVVLATASAVAQESPKPATARDMYFGGIEAPAPPVRRPTTAKRKPATAKKRPALGLRYSILQAKGAERIEVPRNTVFRSGDRIQLKIRPNEDGYMYVVHQGTSGDWSPVFPHPKRDLGSNRVEAGRDYVLPPDQMLRFSGQPGTEKLFVLMTRTPEPSIDRVIYQMREGSGSQPAPAQSNPPVLMASNAVISNSVVESLRRSYTRDLVFDDEGGGADESTRPTAASRDAGMREVATYVVNTSAQPDARVVAEILLMHR